MEEESSRFTRRPAAVAAVLGIAVFGVGAGFAVSGCGSDSSGNDVSNAVQSVQGGLSTAQGGLSTAQGAISTAQQQAKSVSTQVQSVQSQIQSVQSQVSTAKNQYGYYRDRGRLASPAWKDTSCVTSAWPAGSPATCCSLTVPIPWT